MQSIGRRKMNSLLDGFNAARLDFNQIYRIGGKTIPNYTLLLSGIYRASADPPPMCMPFTILEYIVEQVS